MAPGMVTTALLRSDRARRVYLGAWLVLLAVTVGAGTGLLVAAHRPAPAPSLTGGIVFGAGARPAPAFALRDQAGALVSPAALRGRVYALTFLDTQCTQVCPLQASLLGSVQSDLGRQAPPVVVVSVRPAVDTPAAVGAYAAAHGLAGELHWLDGSQAQLAPVWDAYGVTAQVVAGDVQHTAVIYLVDRDGQLRVAFPDLPDQAAVEADVRILEAG